MGIRIVTASILLALAYMWLFVAPYEFFVIGSLAIYAIAAHEMGALFPFKSKIVFLLIATAVLTTIFYFAPPGLYIDGIVPSFIYYLIYASVIVWVVSLPLLKSFPHNTAWQQSKVVTTVLGLLLLLPFFFGLLILRATNYRQDPNEGAFLVLAVMALVWLADSGAYFSGRFFGKHKLLEMVSPKKTLEGVYGGVAIALLGLYLFSEYGCYSYYQTNTIALYVSGVIAILFSIVGDLVESMLKRISGIKDSGKIFPGHGGMLDRIDSQLASIPLFITVNLLLTQYLA